MDLYPLYNSIRISALSMIIVFFIGIFSAYYISKASSLFKSVADILLTLPLVLPPTVSGYIILKIIGPNTAAGRFINDIFNVKMSMTWRAAVIATSVVIFPLMYRTARGAFESFDEDFANAGKTLGLSDTYIFWRIRMPNCRQGILAGMVLAFARALGEYGATSMVAGYIPGRTATIATTVYQLWRTDDDVLAMKWIMINMAISVVVLFIVNNLEKRKRD